MKTRRIEFEYCALQYLNMWLATEREAYEDFSTTDPETRRNALLRFAAEYRISRNLWTRFEEASIPRFKPVIDILDTFAAKDFVGDSLLPRVKEVRDEIAKKYGGVNALSLTTKFLWLKFRSPIIIYDRQAREALRTVEGNIDTYCATWRIEFEKHISQIIVACASLPGVHKFTCDPDTGTPDYIAEVTSESWFHERVFDIYLWKGGWIDR